MILGENITLKDLQIGKKMYIPKPTTDYLDEIFNSPFIAGRGEFKNIVPGCYYVTKIENLFIDNCGLPDYAQSKVEISIMHKNWDENADKPIHLVLNCNADIILAGAIILGEDKYRMKSVIYELNDLIEANKDRTTCVCCKQPLNIISVNLKICKACETSFSQGTFERIETEEEILDFENNGDTTKDLDMTPLLP